MFSVMTITGALLLSACTAGVDTDTDVDAPTPPAVPNDDAAGGGTRPAAGEPARLALSNRLNVPVEEIEIVEAELTDWPDACLGLPAEDEMCAQVITPGYDVTLSYEGELYHYRTDIEGNIVRAEEQ